MRGMPFTERLRSPSGAVTEIHGRRVNVTAWLLEDRERADAWKLLLRVRPHFERYALRATERELLVFRLTER
jgi:hypothetical protein